MLQTTALRDQRKILKDKLQNWEAVRVVYMPGLLQIQTNLGRNPTAIWSSNPNPEDVDIWLPSAIPVNQRRAACVEGLPEMELRLRTAQCSSSLQGLRQALRVKTRMVYFKNKNIRGQKEGTRSRAIIDRVHMRAIRFVQKYRVARQAKLALEGPGDWEQTYRELLNEDIRGFATAKPKKNKIRRGIWEDGHAPQAPDPMEVDDESEEEEEESEPDIDAATQRAPTAKKKRKKGTGETRRELSWIWLTTPLSLDASEEDDILRAEWARSRARVRRATEEVMLLREEMRRVLAFLKWKAKWWDDRVDARSVKGHSLKEGINAYAVEQARLQRTLSVSFLALWKTPLAEIEGVLQGLDHDVPEADVNNPEGADEDGEDDEDGDYDEGPDGDIDTEEVFV